MNHAATDHLQQPLKHAYLHLFELARFAWLPCDHVLLGRYSSIASQVNYSVIHALSAVAERDQHNM